MKIGTRGSPLALVQTREVLRMLTAAHVRSEDEFEIVVIKTTGDMIQDRALAEAGGKGLFTKEIDAAMLGGQIDAAVHSSKDLPSVLPDGVTIAGYLPREDVRDALISLTAGGLAGLPKSARVGSASARRAAQVKRLRPDVTIELLRGNVETRLRKVETGVVDATLLAYAGLEETGLGSPRHDNSGDRRFSSRSRSGRHRRDGAHERCGDAYSPRPDPRCGDRARARRRAGFSRRPRRLLPDADRRSRAHGFRCARFSRNGFSGRRSESFEVRTSGPVADARRIGADAGRDLLARLPAGVLA